jgi:hypothetical protein
MPLSAPRSLMNQEIQAAILIFSASFGDLKRKEQEAFLL